MNILLTAINAKYIHSNLAVFSLQAYSRQRGVDLEVAEYTINQRVDYIIEEIYRKKPELLIFSCYIWNIEYVTEVAAEFHKLCPDVPIWAGGPEVSYETETFLNNYPQFTGVMMGEGERTLFELCSLYESSAATTVDLLGANLEKLSGISWRDAFGTVHQQPLQSLLSMDELPFCYEQIEDFENRIIYYESSRGCPFRCSYCLSSVDKRLRFRSLPLVYRELQFFLDHRVPQVKFVDRTFNCDHEHARGIWRYILEHDNGVTNFHFEVSADLLTQEEIELIRQMRPGLIQLEIGVQSTNDKTIREIKRTMRLPQVHAAVQKVQEGRNIHQHLDLIAGLPYEDYATFQNSFDEIYAWKPDQLQLGFLKVLKGSYMFEHAGEYGLVYRTRAPYEVMETNWLSFEDILKIRMVEEMLELHYNSGQFVTALSVLEPAFESAFDMFLQMGMFYKERGYADCNHSRIRRTEIFLEFALEAAPEKEEIIKEALIFDLYKLEKSKSRPKWARDLAACKKQTGAWLREHQLEKSYCHLEAFDWLRPENGRMVPSGDGNPQWILFAYEERNPLNNEAALIMAEGLHANV